jgi:hypothetical protein
MLVGEQDGQGNMDKFSSLKSGEVAGRLQSHFPENRNPTDMAPTGSVAS